MTQTAPNRKEMTRQALIDAAFSLFASKGFAGTTTREIAERAGVNELTLFRHFQNKANLLAGVLLEHSTLSVLEKELSRIAPMSFEDGLHEIARVFMAVMQEKYPIIRLMIIETATNPELKDLIGPIPVRLRQLLMAHFKKGKLEGKVRPDVNLELAAQSFLWIFLSYVMTRSDVGTKFFPFSREDVVHTATQIFLRGLSDI